jgi:hypothetical protein
MNGNDEIFQTLHLNFHSNSATGSSGNRNDPVISEMEAPGNGPQQDQGELLAVAKGEQPKLEIIWWLLSRIQNGQRKTRGCLWGNKAGFDSAVVSVSGKKHLKV